MSAGNSPAIQAGTLLGGVYHLTRLIGQGGMGAVFEAMHQRLSKRVAVKLMSSELAASDEALARFQREALITSQLGHPHLVNIVDFGVAESGEPYMVMEFLNGEDLERRIRREGALPVEIAIQIAKQTASALHAAHSQGVVHRDLKPANIFLMQVPGEPDFVKVLDFGVSKVKAARTKITRVSTVIGTPHYMSPEQAMGMVDDIDPRADQWALACIVWEMLSGRSPFGADDVSALFYQILNLEPQPLAKLAPHVPTGVEEVLRHALAKDPARRYASIKAFYRELESVALQFPLDPTPAPMPLAQLLETSKSQAYAPLPPLDPPRRNTRTGLSSTDAGWEQTRRRTATAIRVPSRGQIRIAGRMVPWWALALPVACILLVLLSVRVLSSPSKQVPQTAKGEVTSASQAAPNTAIILPLEPLPTETAEAAPAKSVAPVPATTGRSKRTNSKMAKPNPFGSKNWIGPFDESGTARTKSPGKTSGTARPRGPSARKASPFGD